MAGRGSVTDKGRSLNSIKLRDFPENEGLAEDFYDRETETEATDETFVMTRSQIPDDDDGSDGLVIRSVSNLFDDDDISAGDTTLISAKEVREQAERYENGSAERGDLSDIQISSEDLAIASAASRVLQKEVAPEQHQAENTVPENEETVIRTKKRSVPAPSRDQINRNPGAAKKAAVRKEQKKPVRVKDFGTKKHSVAYRVIKFCIFLLLWIAVAFASYQLYRFGYNVLNDQPMDPADASKVQISVTGNETNDEMGELLYSYGLIEDVGIFKWRCLLYSADYQAGTFRLSRSYNTEKILNILAGYTYADSSEEESSEGVETLTEAETDAAENGADAAENGDAENGDAENGADDAAEEDEEG